MEYFAAGDKKKYDAGVVASKHAKAIIEGYYSIFPLMPECAGEDPETQVAYHGQVMLSSQVATGKYGVGREAFETAVEASTGLCMLLAYAGAAGIDLGPPGDITDRVARNRGLDLIPLSPLRQPRKEVLELMSIPPQKLRAKVNG